MGGLNKRADILKVGQNLIWAKGYAGCSVKDITTASGLPKGSFYHYFESKEKFALEAMADYVTEFEEPLPDEHYDLNTLEKLIDLRIQSVTKVKYARECYLSMMCHAYIDQEESFRKAIVQAIERSNHRIENLMKQLISKGLIKTTLNPGELNEYLDLTWRGARLKARITKSAKPLKIFKKHFFELITT